MFALLAGCHNLGATISNNLGAVLIEWLEITPNGSDDESEKFKNLWIASLVACVLPTMSIVLVPSFIPDKMQTEKILDDEDMPANHGSLWRWWWYGEDLASPRASARTDRGPLAVTRARWCAQRRPTRTAPQLTCNENSQKRLRMSASS